MSGRRRFVPWIRAAGALCVLLAACSEGTVTAPQGGSILLEANPAAIGLGGESQITALVRDQDGNPVRGDVEVLFFTDLGGIDRAARTNSQGLATATLTAGNTSGTATVRAVAGSIEASIGVPVGTQVGSITLQADPDNLPATGGEIELLAVVRDSNGDTVEGAPVTFASEPGIGTLDSGGQPVDTDDSGEARDRVVVTPDEIDAWDRPTFEVTATTPGPDGSLLQFAVDIELPSQLPNAQFSVVPGPGGGTNVQFQDESTGPGPLMYEWDFESDDNVDSNAPNPVHDYQVDGTYNVTLKVNNSAGEDIVMQSITVPVPTP